MRAIDYSRWGGDVGRAWVDAGGHGEGVWGVEVRDAGERFVDADAPLYVRRERACGCRPWSFRCAVNDGGYPVRCGRGAGVEMAWEWWVRAERRVGGDVGDVSRRRERGVCIRSWMARKSKSAAVASAKWKRVNHAFRCVDFDAHAGEQRE